LNYSDDVAQAFVVTVLQARNIPYLASLAKHFTNQPIMKLGGKNLIHASKWVFYDS